MQTGFGAGQTNTNYQFGQTNNQLGSNLFQTPKTNTGFGGFPFGQNTTTASGFQQPNSLGTFNAFSKTGFGTSLTGTGFGSNLGTYIFINKKFN